MSAARSLKMPDIPVADAIASICMSMASKIGPSVSERTYSSSSAQSVCAARSEMPTQARGFSRMFLMVLLKNWNDNAAWVSST